MGIINTFEKCLESPYLVPDLEATARVTSLLEAAGDKLESARLLLAGGGKGDQADVIFLSYESMFAAIRALVYAKGYREAGLRCLLIACFHFYIEPGLLDPAHLHALERVQGVRVTPEEAIAAAHSLLEAAGPLAQPSPAATAAPSS